jgi:hypothetical protein
MHPHYGPIELGVGPGHAAMPVNFYYHLSPNEQHCTYQSYVCCNTHPYISDISNAPSIPRHPSLGGFTAVTAGCPD